MIQARLDLIEQLRPFCRDNRLEHAVMETQFEIPNSGNNRKPDVTFVAFDRWAADCPLPRVNDWPVAPDLAAELVEPASPAGGTAP
ncbi:MAG: Uma2 family endonuclease [Gemmataceae bacterium]|nr:Uma2 family endonuclease [Gemmataceae bacterium]